MAQLPYVCFGLLTVMRSHSGHVLLPYQSANPAAAASVGTSLAMASYSMMMLEWERGLYWRRDLLYLDVALENVVRSAAERGSGAAGANAGALVGPLLQNLVLSVGDNEELCYCLKAWQALPSALRRGGYPSKEDALKVRRPVLLLLLLLLSAFSI